MPKTKLTHIVMNNSCVVPLIETGREIGEGIIFGDKGYGPLSHSDTRKITLSWYMFVVVVASCDYVFLFERILIMHIAHKVFQEYINLVSLSIWPFVSLFVCPSICPFVNF